MTRPRTRGRSIALAAALALAAGDVAAAGPRPYVGPEDAPVEPAAPPEPFSDPNVPAVDPGAEPEPEPQPVEDEPGPAVPEPAVPEPEDDTPVADPRVDDYDEVRDSPEGRIATRRIRGGIILTSVGSALIIGAVILGASDPCAYYGGNSCMAQAKNRGALTMGVPGALILVAGITLLGVGVGARRKIAARVQADRTSAGLVISGRF